jgi:predicted nucleotidyltransferase
MTRGVPGPLQRGLGDYARRLESRFGVRLRHARLFGSWARGQARSDSDIDVAVVIDGLSRAEWALAINDAVDVEAATGLALTPFVLSGERFDHLVARERRIARDILEEGLPL